MSNHPHSHPDNDRSGACQALITLGNVTVGARHLELGAGYLFDFPVRAALWKLNSARFYSAGGAKTQTFTPVVDLMTDGKPTILVAKDAAASRTGQSAEWVTAAFPGVSISGRPQYLADLMSGPSAQGTKMRYASISDAGLWPPAGTSAPPETWPSVNRESASWNILLQYTTG